MSGVWARSQGVSICATEHLDVEARPTLRQALADGIERGFEGKLPSLPENAECYRLRANSADVGALVLIPAYPTLNDVTLFALVIDSEWRGNAFATKALLATERRLLREGKKRLVARVPRTNGRGLYFMLRAGFTPMIDASPNDTTWFIRGGAS